ncbi:MAG TPA: hypothetical protein VFQ60_04325 [Patescibacteria group bacterium]|nr:hypothetical protein [Patescibacteria group bacterium]
MSPKLKAILGNTLSSAAFTVIVVTALLGASHPRLQMASGIILMVIIGIYIVLTGVAQLRFWMPERRKNRTLKELLYQQFLIFALIMFLYLIFASSMTAFAQALANNGKFEFLPSKEQISGLGIAAAFHLGIIFGGSAWLSRSRKKETIQ